MFTNLANLLLGASAPAAPEEEATCSAMADEGGELSVQEAEDDWLLVDNDLQRGALLASMAVAPLTPLARSRSHSASSLPTLEESWFVTPPPCFTSTGPVELETSPLENLLIEHPSMSVYQRPTPHAPAPAPRSASLSPPPRARQPLAAVNPRPPRAPCVTLAKQQQQQAAAVQAAQKVQLKVGASQMRRTALERTNKARDVGSARNKRPRRSDHQMRHSGANNNRKQC